MTVSIASYHPSHAYGGDVVPSATAHTKGSYLQFTAATAFAATTVKLTIRDFTAAGRFLLDLATGAAGAETVAVANVLMHGGTGGAGISHVLLPVAIGASVRIAARAQQSGTAVMTISLVLHVLAGDTNAVLGGGTAATYGATTATTDGTAVDPGGSAGVKGPYVQMTAATSTPSPLYELVLALRTQNTLAAEAYMVDIATGAGGAETLSVPDISLTTNINVAYNNFQKWPVNIASGTRIAVRALCGDAGSPQRINNVVLIGFAGTLNVGGGGSSTKLYLGSTAVYPA